MQTVLFHSTIFGPIHSRRLGTSLGINLMPNDGKVCTFDCLYCEAGFNAQGTGTTGLPTRQQVATQLEAKLKTMLTDKAPLDVITFSGNGEPTLHPYFEAIIHDTIELRNQYYPQAAISVLSNSTRIDRPDIVRALLLVDNNILKLDSAIDSTITIIDRPTSLSFNAATVIDQLKQFNGKCIIQTMMLRGEYDGHTIDNTTPHEIEQLIKAYNEIMPSEIMLYSIDRATPARQLVKVEREQLEAIANLIRSHGHKVQVA